MSRIAICENLRRAARYCNRISMDNQFQERLGLGVGLGGWEGWEGWGSI